MTKPQVIPRLSVVIPTVAFGPYLDDAISSALRELSPKAEILVSVNSQELASFTKSVYFNHPNVRWVCSGGGLPPHESWNFAVENSLSEWVILLSDDDKFLEGAGRVLWEHVEGNSNSPLILRHGVGSLTNDAELKPEHSSIKGSISVNLILAMSASSHLKNHLSLAMFRRVDFAEVEGFSDCGFPNGFYVDSIFFLRLFCRYQRIPITDELIFGRRLGSLQGSAKFFFGSDVAKYIELVQSHIRHDGCLKRRLPLRFNKNQKVYFFLLTRHFLGEIARSKKTFYGTDRPAIAALLRAYFFNWGPFSIAKIIGLLEFIVIYIHTSSRIRLSLQS